MAENRITRSPSGRFLYKQHNAAVAPAVTDDYGSGYPQFSEWLDTVTQTLYTSIDDTDNTAVWIPTGGAGASLLQPSARGWNAGETLVMAGAATPVALNIAIGTIPADVGFALVGTQLVYTGPTRRFLINASCNVMNQNAGPVVHELSLTVLGTAAQADARGRASGITNAIAGTCSFSTIADLATGQGVGLQLANITNGDDITYTTGQITVTAL